MSKRTCLYRWFSSADDLLYVGITGDFDQRTAEHRAHSEWWPDAVRHTVVWFETHEEARSGELAALATESPIFNRQQNGNRHSLVGQYQQRRLTAALGEDPLDWCMRWRRLAIDRGEVAPWWSVLAKYITKTTGVRCDPTYLYERARREVEVSGSFKHLSNLVEDVMPMAWLDS